MFMIIEYLYVFLRIRKTYSLGRPIEFLNTRSRNGVCGGEEIGKSSLKYDSNVVEFVI